MAIVDNLLEKDMIVTDLCSNHGLFRDHPVRTRLAQHHAVTLTPDENQKYTLVYDRRPPMNQPDSLFVSSPAISSVKDLSNEQGALPSLIKAVYPVHPAAETHQPLATAAIPDPPEKEDFWSDSVVSAAPDLYSVVEETVVVYDRLSSLFLFLDYADVDDNHICRLWAFRMDCCGRRMDVHTGLEA
jgi:hypothetical protein